MFFCFSIKKSLCLLDLRILHQSKDLIPHTIYIQEADQQLHDAHSLR